MKYWILILQLASASVFASGSYDFCNSIADKASVIMEKRQNQDYAMDLYKKTETDKNGFAVSERLKRVIDRAFEIELVSNSSLVIVVKEFKSKEFLRCIDSHRVKN